MSSFKEIQEKFKENIKKEDIKDLPTDKLHLFVAPIKFELVNNEYHIFLMMVSSVEIVILADDMNIASEENFKNLMKDKLSIILPANDNNNVYLPKSKAAAYVFDGSKLNIDMINHLRQLNGHKNNEYNWYDINLRMSSFFVQELKDIITSQIANGRIFE